MANAASGPLRTRRDVWKLPPGDTTLEWYGKAIAEQVAYLHAGVDGLFTDQADIGVRSRQYAFAAV